jgi:hypothetical protein
MVSIFGPPVRETERVREAFADDERAWERIGFGARLLTGVAVTGWLFSIFDWPAAVYYTAFVVTLVLIGYGHIRVTALHKRRVPLRALLITLDFALLTIAILFSNPLADWELPARMRLEIGTFDFYFVLLVSIGLTYSALRVFWAGLMAAACWSAAVCCVLGAATARRQDDVRPSDVLRERVGANACGPDVCRLGRCVGTVDYHHLGHSISDCCRYARPAIGAAAG